MQTSFSYQADHATKLFLNANGGITIEQERFDETVILSIGSKKRALEVARAIRNLAALATWEADEDESQDDE